MPAAVSSVDEKSARFSSHFFVIHRGSQLALRTHLEKVLIFVTLFRDSQGVPTDLLDV